MLLNYYSQHSSLEGGVNCSERAFGGRLYRLAVGSGRSLTVGISTPNCLNCLALIIKDQFVSNTIGTMYFAIDIKPDKVRCKPQNYIYLLTCTHL